jgi:hypothetical protein
MSPERKNVTQAEAQAKVGKVVRSLQEVASVPQGTLADVIAADPMGTSKPMFGEAFQVFDVAVQWRLQELKPLVDWFSKEEYEKYLQEVEAEQAEAKGRELTSRFSPLRSSRSSNVWRS